MDACAPRRLNRTSDPLLRRLWDVHNRRQIDLKSGSTSTLQLARTKPDRSLMPGNQRLRHPKPQSGTAQLLRRKKRVEDVRPYFQRNACAPIMDGDPTAPGPSAADSMQPHRHL